MAASHAHESLRVDVGTGSLVDVGVGIGTGVSVGAGVGIGVRVPLMQLIVTPSSNRVITTPSFCALIWSFLLVHTQLCSFTELPRWQNSSITGSSNVQQEN